MRVTKPSTDLNRYIVDKFHPPTARAKQVPFESIDLSIYKPSARCLAFCTSEDRLLFWITALTQRYYELLTRQTMGYKITWKEQDGYSSPSKCDKLVIHLVETTPSSEEELLVTITVFIMTGRIQVQGKRIEERDAHEFPVLLECVNKLSDIKHFAGISSIPDQYQSIFASSLHNFFVNFIHFVAEEGIPSSNRPRSIYQYSSMTPRLSGQNCKFFKLLLSLNSQKRLGYKENNTKYRILTRKPRCHVRILIYRTWPIATLPMTFHRKRLQQKQPPRQHQIMFSCLSQ